MKKSLTYVREHMFQTFGKIIFAVIAFILMKAFLTVRWDPLSLCMLFITLAFLVVINACLEGYLSSNGEDIPPLIVGICLFILATALYFLAHFEGDFEGNPLNVANFCYITLIANVLFSFVGPAIEKYKYIVLKRSGLFVK